ncbi:MAG TPA: FAD-dependent oxidoreductase [Burkholderiales bacterium]|nr:FAD-dependent oxidoreductase [Burkholderiales bacterium]
MTRLLLLGGGHAHALVLLKFRKFISKNLAVTLVTPGPVHVYSGMVPGVVAGHYAAADAQIGLVALARQAGAELIQGRVRRLDPEAKEAVLESGDAVSYDYASLNLGSLPDFSGVPGAAVHAIAVKPFEPFFAGWRALLEKGPKAPRIAIAGAGAGGVELAMAMKFALDLRGTGGSVELFSERNVFPPGVAERIRNALARHSIPLHAEAPVTAVDAGPTVASRLGRERFDAVYWTAGATALPMLRESGLKTDARGFVLVDASLRSVSHPDVLAAGDTASLEGAALPKSGVYAVREGAVLAENLKGVVRGLAMRDFVPQKASLVLISCGAKYAIASRGGWSAEGAWAWRWKDWLDRRWIRKFS